MRIQPTFEQLVNTTIGEAKIVAPQLPYIPYSNNADALLQLRAMSEQIKGVGHHAQYIAHDTHMVSRDEDIPTRLLEQIAAGTVREQ